MCARCERTTNDPVLILEVHASTGASSNVYTCRECAIHYPSPTDALTLEPTRRRSRMTLHVYKMGTKGTVTDDRGKLEILAGEHTAPVPYTSAYPAYTCTRCRTTR
jgi:hypothetical protein